MFYESSGHHPSLAFTPGLKAGVLCEDKMGYQCWITRFKMQIWYRYTIHFDSEAALIAYRLRWG